MRDTDRISPHRLADWTDQELLQVYAETKAENAFAEIVVRHGPMVLAACQRAGFQHSY